ncbi:hypothetical protein [Streptomyces djakartensis]|uniref:Uncharacterized protein n=1 Tax=Streptomyces djakartensis TaxID=68193 RepID=A0ABQ3A3F4_9ACTN|nr:hypothetical protein [Streptomyces djakartensis]GGY33998.1 hypothetical protein GCM10010384_46510 [Streptomyces djakartensis]
MTTPGFRPTHIVPQHGMPAWEAPDPARPTVDLDPLLPVQLLARQGDWGHVLCSNGWSAWVDGRRLVAVPQDPPSADGALTRGADPRPLLGRAQEALARYRSAVEDLAHGMDRESFHTRTHGLRIGVVVDGESVWLYDAAHGHWVYSEGAGTTTYATDETPRADPASHPARPPAPVPTRVVPPEAAGEAPRSEWAPPAAPEPTRVVSPEAREPRPAGPPEAPEPTRVVSSADPGSTRLDEDRDRPAQAPPTRVVSPGPEDEDQEAEEADRPAEAPPTRVVGAEPTRAVSPEGDAR